MELSHKKLLSRQTCKLDNTHLHITSWNIITGKKNWAVRYDQIDIAPPGIRQMGIFSSGCGFAAFIVILSTLVVMSLPWITSLIIVLIAMSPVIIARIVNSYDYLEVQTRYGPVLFSYSNADKARTDEFVLALKEAIKKYMLWRYGTLDSDLDFKKQVENFWWLRNNNFITDEEYNALKANLKNNPGK